MGLSSPARSSLVRVPPSSLAEHVLISTRSFKQRWVEYRQSSITRKSTHRKSFALFARWEFAEAMDETTKVVCRPKWHRVQRERSLKQQHKDVQLPILPLTHLRNMQIADSQLVMFPANCASFSARSTQCKSPAASEPESLHTYVHVRVLHASPLSLHDLSLAGLLQRHVCLCCHTRRVERTARISAALPRFPLSVWPQPLFVMTAWQLATPRQFRALSKPTHGSLLRSGLGPTPNNTPNAKV